VNTIDAPLKVTNGRTDAQRFVASTSLDVVEELFCKSRRRRLIAGAAVILLASTVFDPDLNR
jgi:hypothetical protein